MNDRIDQLAKQCWNHRIDGTLIDGHLHFDHRRFAELIVQECYHHCKDQLMERKTAEKAGLDYNDGVMDCAIGLLQHFGIDR